ncbi:B3 domain-containing protein-like [Iris pallida]|nr:B3 domain-containing protein-like [Iris pallida]
MINSSNGGEQAGGAAAGTPTGNTRRLRLFGVNLECGAEQPEPEHFAPPSWSQFMPTNPYASQL